MWGSVFVISVVWRFVRVVHTNAWLHRGGDFGLVVTRTHENDALSLTNPLGDQGLRMKVGVRVWIRVRVINFPLVLIECH